jgi:2,4-dienoyl-CoA reductase (NADPH2)
VADPELPNKVRSGRLGDIVPCAGCGYCVHTRLGDNPLKCRMNPAAGRELEYDIKPAEKKKRVLIAGGGLAGMEAARVAALRGHDVILCDKATKLGGLVPVAAIVKERERDSLVDVVRYYEKQLTDLAVTVKPGVTVDVEMIQKLRPDVVILGTGGLNPTPDIPGIDSPKVVRSENLHRTLRRALKVFGPKMLDKLTRFWMPLGKRIVIIGGGMQGIQLAHFLAVRKKSVIIVDTTNVFGEGIPYQTPLRYFKWFSQEGVAMLPGVTYERITDGGLMVQTKEGARKLLVADSIIVALPLRPDEVLYEALKREKIDVFKIGDCREFGLMHGAIADGAEIGRII